MDVVRSALRIAALAGALLSLGACGDAGRSSAPPEQAERQGGTGKFVTNTPSDDPQLLAAIARARATIPGFLPHLQHPPAVRTYLGVKVRLGEPGGDREQIWLSDVRYEGGMIVGRLLESADYFPQWKEGDVYRVAPDQVADWMFIANGHVCGGFTSRLRVPQLPADEQREWFEEMEIDALPAGDAVCDEGGSL